MNAVLSALVVVLVIGMMGASLVVDLLRYTPNPVGANSTGPERVPAYATPLPTPTEGGFYPPGFRGPSAPPNINGPSAPPPSE